MTAWRRRVTQCDWARGVCDWVRILDAGQRRRITSHVLYRRFLSSSKSSSAENIYDRLSSTDFILHLYMRTGGMWSSVAQLERRLWRRARLTICSLSCQKLSRVLYLFWPHKPVYWISMVSIKLLRFVFSPFFFFSMMLVRPRRQEIKWGAVEEELPGDWMELSGSAGWRAFLINAMFWLWLARCN